MMPLGTLAVLLALVSGWSSAAPRSTREEVYSLDYCGGLGTTMKELSKDQLPSRYQIALVHNKKETCLHWSSECPLLHKSTNGTRSCIEGLMWCLKWTQPDLQPCYQCDAVHGSCENGFFLIEASYTSDMSPQCQATEPPSEVCFKEVSIDVSCTLTVDEGSAAFCVGEERPDAQLGAWIAMTASVATVVAFVAIGAVVACQMMKHYRSAANAGNRPLQPNYGAIQPDGGPPLPDGGPPLPDGGPPLPDGGPPLPDGGPPLPDGGPPPPAGGQILPPVATPELISDLGKSTQVWFDTVPNPSSVLVPNLATKTSSSDSEGPKTSDSSQPTSMETEDDKQAALGEGENHQPSPLLRSTISSPSTGSRSKRKNKGAEPAKQTQDVSSDPDTGTPRNKRPSKKKRSTSSSYDPAGLAEKMSTTGSSQVEGGSED